MVETTARTIQWLELQSDDRFEDASSRIEKDGAFRVVLGDGCELQLDRKTAFA